MSFISLSQIENYVGVIHLTGEDLGINYDTTQFTTNVVPTPNELQIRPGGIGYTEISASTFNNTISDTGALFGVNVEAPVYVTGAGAVGLNVAAPIIISGGQATVNYNTSLTLSGTALAVNLNEGVYASALGISLQWINDIGWGATPDARVPILTKTGAATYSYSGIDSEDVYKVRSESGTTVGYLNTLLSTTASAVPAGGPDTVAAYYDAATNKNWFDILDGSIKVNHLSNTIDATGIGFNADQVDGADLNDAGTTATDLWSANQVIAYVAATAVDSGMNSPVIDKDLSTPPGAPAGGDAYIVQPVGLGAWAGQDNAIATWDGAAWGFRAAEDGLMVFVEDEDIWYVYDSGAGPAAWVTIYSFLDHTNLQNIGTNSHAQIDTHIGTASLHFTEASIDHTAITNIGGNTHAQIDIHIGDGNLHYTVGSINFTDLGDVEAGPAGDDIMVWKPGAPGSWEHEAMSYFDIGTLGNVNTAVGLADGDLLQYQTNVFAPVSPGSVGELFQWSLVDGGTHGYATLTAAIAGGATYIYVDNAGSVVAEPGAALITVSNPVTIVSSGGDLSTLVGGGGPYIDLATNNAQFEFDDKAIIEGLAIKTDLGAPGVATPVLSFDSGSSVRDMSIYITDGAAPGAQCSVLFANEDHVSFKHISAYYASDVGNVAVVSTGAALNVIVEDISLEAAGAATFSNVIPFVLTAGRSTYSDFNVTSGAFDNVAAVSIAGDELNVSNIYDLAVSFTAASDNVELTNVVGGLTTTLLTNSRLNNLDLTAYSDVGGASGVEFNRCIFTIGANLTINAVGATFNYCDFVLGTNNLITAGNSQHYNDCNISNSILIGAVANNHVINCTVGASIVANDLATHCKIDGNNVVNNISLGTSGAAAGSGFITNNTMGTADMWSTGIATGNDTGGMGVNDHTGGAAVIANNL